MICPICETDNGEESVCAECGKVLVAAIEPELEVEPIESYQQTQVGADDLDMAFELAALDGASIPAIEALEPTLLADRKAEVSVEPLELDSPLPESAAAVPGYWESGVLELDLGRTEDLDPKTAAPDPKAPCPFCGFPGEGAVCNNCGRRRNRFTSDPDQPIASAGDTLLCPACYSRVAADAICTECKSPLPRMELM